MEGIKIFDAVDTAVVSKAEECLTSCFVGVLFRSRGVEVKSKNLEVFAADAYRRCSCATSDRLEINGRSNR